MSSMCEQESVLNDKENAIGVPDSFYKMIRKAIDFYFKYGPRSTKKAVIVQQWFKDYIKKLCPVIKDKLIKKFEKVSYQCFEIYSALPCVDGNIYICLSCDNVSKIGSNYDNCVLETVKNPESFEKLK
jgi:hypothetical protein